MIANYAAMDIKPGSMGRPLPGIEAAIVARDAEATSSASTVGRARARTSEGELALRPGWPSMFRGYLDEEERYRKCFAGGWYLTGDLARRDADGYFWFVGRGDDVIKSAGPPDRPVRGRERADGAPGRRRGRRDRQARPGRGRAWSRRSSLLKPGFERERRAAPRAARPTPARGSARRSRPRRSSSATTLPHTRSGKIMRRLLQGPRARPARGRPLDAGERADDRSVHARPAARARPPRCCGRCCASGASRRRASSSTAPRRSAASCTSTSARRRSRSGVDAGARARTTRSSRPTASTATRSRAASRPSALMAEMFGKRRGLQPRPRRLDAPVRRRHAASTAATPSSAAACRSPSAWRWPTSMQRRRPRHRLLLRRGRGRRGRVPRVDEPRGAVAAAGAVLLREQPLRDGHRARALRVRDRPRR